MPRAEDYAELARRHWDRKLPKVEMLQTKDIARYTGIEIWTIQRAIRRGDLVALGSTRRRRHKGKVPRVAVLDWLVRRMMPADLVQLREDEEEQGELFDLFQVERGQ